MKLTPQDGFPYYIDLVKGEELNALFSSTVAISFLKSLNEEKASYRYAPHKWSIKQIIGHITDHERIKMFRAFQLSRKMKVELWGYDQNLLVSNARFEELTIEQLIIDFSNVRQASSSFIDSLSENQLQIKGMAREHKITLEDFLKSIIGHEKHHLDMIRERYL
ncbi:DinB family protein [Ekhidna sp.]|uniref:DinB family protein n=1 Tax=Ekhidna sp. TaxID=2608089 RepID=UPI0032F0371D